MIYFDDCKFIHLESNSNIFDITFSNVTFYNSIFLNSISHEGYLSSSISSVVLQDSSISYTSHVDGFIYATAHNNIFIDNCNFTKLTAERGSILNCDGCDMNISNSIITN